MEQPQIVPTLYCQYHAYWCPSDLRSQLISRHDIEQINRDIPFLASEELSTFIHGIYLLFLNTNVVFADEWQPAVHKQWAIAI